ncbi:MAG TPA: 2Fe-2S iron-sulfur cluster-binding protein, partial [Flexilinea sp.]|nr:2Fe-2S iron-sulfur cluster-binding protein [Flexilinea sp.]
MSKVMLSCKINGEEIHSEIPSDMRLIDFLREEMNLTGVKEGCSEGECGACTVLFNGDPVNSCILLAIQAEGAEITTIEGIAKDGRLSE